MASETLSSPFKLFVSSSLSADFLSVIFNHCLATHQNPFSIQLRAPQKRRFFPLKYVMVGDQLRCQPRPPHYQLSSTTTECIKVHYENGEKVVELFQSVVVIWLPLFFKSHTINFSLTVVGIGVL